MSASQFSYSISIETQNQTGAVLAVYLTIRKGRTKVTREYAKGDVFADYDSQGQLLGIEILAPCRDSGPRQNCEASAGEAIRSRHSSAGDACVRVVRRQRSLSLRAVQSGWCRAFAANVSCQRSSSPEMSIGRLFSSIRAKPTLPAIFFPPEVNRLFVTTAQA